MARIDAFFEMLVAHGASDLHMIAGQQPMLRLDGDIERIDYPALENIELKRLLYEITPDTKVRDFEESGDIDFSYELPQIGRFRVNFFNQLTGIAAVFRLIPHDILTLEELKLPVIINKFCALEKGLVIVTGPTGSGKSTTLAAMVDAINATRKCHILTVEDPVEFVHTPKLASVNHREVGTHTRSFSAALRGALREDPDVILVGEMRDLETISLAIEAASTGHLVLATLHTQSAAKTIDRIIDVFPALEQAKIRATLSEALKGVIAQALIKRPQGGRAAALEILFCNTAVANLIREEKTHQLPSYMQGQKKNGMVVLDDSLMALVKAGQITAESAIERAVDPELFRPLIKGAADDPFR